MPDKIQNMRHRISCSYLTVMLIALLGVSAPVLSNTPARVALIADKASDLYKSPLVSLLEVELSRKDNIQLLERAEIDKILQEQQLSVAGLLQRQKVVKAGRLLRVDAFLLLSTEADKDQKQNRDKLLRVRLVETIHGLRLLDSFEEHGSAKLEDIVKRIIEKVIAAVPKIMLPPNEVIPVGIVDIHRVQLSERYQWLARILPVMLSVRLSKELRIIMLEREDLRILNDEKLLTEGKDAEFWNSAVVIDGYLQRGGTNNDIEMKLRLRRAEDRVMSAFTVPVEPNEPSIAVEKATKDIIQELLNAPPTSSWQPKQEAQEFFRQGQLLMNHNRNKDAIKMLETAHALQPDNVFYTGSLFENEWDARYWIGTFPCPVPRPELGVCYSDLELADVISRLVRQIRAEYEKGSASAVDVLYRWGEPLGMKHYMRGYFTNSASVSTEEIRRINRESRRIWVETTRKALKERPNWQKQRELAWASSDSPEKVMANLKEVFTEFIAPPEMKEPIQSRGRYWFWRGGLLFPPITSIQRIKTTQLRDSYEKCWRLWLQYLQDLTEVEDPLVKFMSCLALLKNLSRVENNDEKKVEDYRRKALEILRKELKTPREPFPDDIKQEIREGIRRYLTIAELEEFCEPLIENQDARNLALWDPGWRFHPGSTPESVRRYVQLLERVRAVLQTCREDKKVREALNHIEDYLAEFSGLPSHLKVAEISMSVSITMLLSEDNWPPDRKFQPPWSTFKTMLKGRKLWIAFDENYHKNSLVQLAGINLEEKKLIALWQIELPRGGRISGLVTGKQTSYVSLNGVGLLEFPGSSKAGKKFLINPRILTREDGLPSISLTGMTGGERKLWLAYGYGAKGKESGLGIYDPKSGSWETVLCSALKGNPPFSAGLPYELTQLIVTEGDKLFFAAKVWGLGSEITTTQWRGLWKINTHTRELTRLWYDQSSPLILGIILGDIVDSGDKLWCKASQSLIQFDPSSEDSKFILGKTRILEQAHPGLKLQADIFTSSWKEIPYGPYLFGNLDLSTAAVHNDKLWARLGKSQLIIIHKGKGFDEADIIYNNILKGGKVLRFFSTPCGLIAIGEGTVGLVEFGGKKE